MILQKQNRVHLSYAPTLFCYLAILLLIVPLRLLLAAIISAVTHELFHILAIRCLRIPINEIYIGLRGARISTQPMTQRQELFCALAGPIGGILLVPFYRWIPAVSLCAFAQTLYNLLPIYPTDGGRVLQCCAYLLLPEKHAHRFTWGLEIVTLSMIVAASIYGSFWLRFGIIPLLFAFSVLLQSTRRK